MDVARRILHLDMDAFFAAVELQRRPELRGQPVVVGGRGNPESRGVVSTATYEARKFGVRSGMPLREAARLCPACVFLPVDFAAYREMSRRFKAELARVSQQLEDRGIDEAYLDITAVPRDSRDIAADLKRAILSATGGLTCSIGIAPNKLLAKMASELDKPDGLTILAPGDVRDRIWLLEARKLPGVGPVTDRRLRVLGIKTIGELAKTPPEQLAAAFGRSHGGGLHRAALGLDDRPVVTVREPKSRSAERTFDEDLSDWQKIAQRLAGLCREVAGDLQSEGYRGRTIGIKLRFADFETLTRDKTLAGPTNMESEIRRAAFECLGRVKLDRKVRLLGVRVGTLERVERA